MTLAQQVAVAIFALPAWLVLRLLWLALTLKDDPEPITEDQGMILSKCGRYWCDVYHDPVHEWCVMFRPVTFDARTEVRGGFTHPHEAARCVEMLVLEHCVDAVEEAA